MRVQPWWWILPLAAVVVVGIYLLRVYDPNVAGNPFFVCPLYKMTGLHCPGCGMTRALHALVHFDLLRAMRMNAFFIFSMPIFALLLLRLYRPIPAFLEICLKPFMTPWPWLFAIPLFGMVRNLPWYPFYLLAPIG